MAYQHDSFIVLMKHINFTKDYTHVLLFDSLEHQYSFFQNDVPQNDKYEMHNCAFIRTSALEGWCSLEGNYNIFEEYTYGYYENPYGSPNKRYYFFITDFEYTNENVTRLRFEIDIMQTYMFDYQLQACYIERAHQDVSDNPGDNVIADSVAVSNMVNSNIQSYTINNGNFWTVIAVSEYPDTLIAVDGEGKPTANWSSAINYYYGLLPSGLTYIVVDSGYFKQFVELYDYAGKREAIYAIYAVPDFLGKTDGYIDNEQHMGIFKPTGERQNPFSGSFSFKLPTGANGYIPKNKKLLTSPYCQLVVVNSTGESISFDPEKFQDSVTPIDAHFKTFGDIGVAGGLYCCPKNYDNNIQDYDNLHILKITDNIQGSWVSDSYLNFTATQSIKNDNTLFHTVFSTATNLLEGNVGNAVSNVINTAMDINTVNKLGEVIPDSLRGASGSSNIQWANNNIKVTAYWRTPDAQTAQVIDDFWSVYGYPQKRIYLPNLFSRKAWNFIKTQNCSLDNTAVPSYILEKIKNIYNRGVTFWHVPHPSQIGNYLLDNGFFGKE